MRGEQASEGHGVCEKKVGQCSNGTNEHVVETKSCDLESDTPERDTPDETTAAAETRAAHALDDDSGSEAGFPFDPMDEAIAE